MLKLVWTPGAVAAPDSAEYANAIDTLSLRDTAPNSAIAKFPRGQGQADVSGLTAAVAGWLGTRHAESAPDCVTLLVHGYQYDPSGVPNSAQDDPFALTYGVPGSPPDSSHPDPHLSWLPIVGETDPAGKDTGLNATIAFAWVSEGQHTLDFARVGWNNPYMYAAFDLAPLAATALAAVIRCLQERGQRFRILAHSLGTRATCQAIGLLKSSWQAGALDRIVLLGGSEYTVDANQNLLGLAGVTTFSLANGKDAVLTYLAHQFSAPVRPVGTSGNRVIGTGGLKPNLPEWLDIQLDRQDVVDWLSHHGFSVASDAAPGDSALHSQAGLNHWVYYMNDGNRAFVRFLLTDPSVSSDWFRSRAFPEGIDSDVYGDFNPETVPPTPATLAERTALFNRSGEVGTNY